jgi:hypothetical protein
MLKSVALGLLLALASLAPAQGQQNPQACATIESPDERLACYDSFFLGEADGALDALTPIENLVLESERLIPARPSGREPATFTIACEEGDIAVYFRFAGQLVSSAGSVAPLTLQVDQGGTQVRTLAASADNTTLSFPNTSGAETFLNTLNGGTNLRARLTPVGQRSLTVDFRIAEALESIRQLRADCQ